ncbi:hypothetical protein ACS0TY_015145 [Phlomoides rotata]
MAGENPNRHVVAVPYPGRGHINPMLNLCRLILQSRPQITVSFVVTEEWLSLLSASPPPSNFRFATIPNVLPAEIGRGKDFAGFFVAAQTKMEAPVEKLLDRLQPPKPSVIIYDTNLGWVVAVGKRRNIPVASLFTMSATVFSISHHSDLILQNDDFSSNIADKGGKQRIINNIPGVPPLRITDLPTPFHGAGQEVLPQFLAAIHSSTNSQYLLFPSVYELEPQVLDSLKQLLPLKIYSLGLSIPHFDLENSDIKPHYLQWLDAQPHNSVLYISQGSFLSVSQAQLEEIIAGVHASGVRFLWVARGEADRVQEQCGGGQGLVVPWCDQLKVLCHPAVGGFWTHCGWNSTKEGAFAGLPMLTFPIFLDQTTNSKMIVDDWKIGVREGKERRRRAKEIQEICRNANCEGGSSHADLIDFIRDVIEG